MLIRQGVLDVVREFFAGRGGGLEAQLPSDMCFKHRDHVWVILIKKYVEYLAMLIKQACLCSLQFLSINLCTTSSDV